MLAPATTIGDMKSIAFKPIPKFIDHATGNSILWNGKSSSIPPPKSNPPYTAAKIYHGTIGCYSPNPAYLAVESRGQVEVAAIEQSSSSPDSPPVSTDRKSTRLNSSH